MTHNKWVFNRRLNCPRLPDCLRSVGKQFHGRRRWSVYVGRRTSQSQTNEVDAYERQLAWMATICDHGKAIRTCEIKWNKTFHFSFISADWRATWNETL